MQNRPPQDVIRTTQLGSIVTCAYKAKNEPYAADPLNTYHGDILNVALTSQGNFKPFLRYYSRKMNGSIGIAKTLFVAMGKVHEYIKYLRSNYEDVFQEAKMFLDYEENVWIEGVPDIRYFNPDGKFNFWDEALDIGRPIWVVEDAKCSTHSWYTGDDMWDYNMQTYVYPLMCMNYHEVDECMFRYIIADKNNGKIKVDRRIRTRTECEAKIAWAMQKYFEYAFMEMFPANRNKLCRFCRFKDTTCPLKKTFEVEMSEDVSMSDDDDGF